MSMICRSRRVSAWACGFLFIIPRPFCYVFSRGAINLAHRKSMSTCPESSRICARAGPKPACGMQARPHKGKDADRIGDATKWDEHATQGCRHSASPSPGLELVAGYISETMRGLSGLGD